MVLVNYTRNGAPFTNNLTLEPLCLGPTSPGRVTHYVGTLCAIPCPEAATAHVEPQLSARFESMDMGARAPPKVNDACGEQPSVCRQLVEDLLAANGDAPVSLPQLVRSPAHSRSPSRLYPAAPSPACLPLHACDTVLRPRALHAPSLLAQLCAMAYLLPVEMATAVVELVGALLRDEVRLSTGEFEGALRILLGDNVAILSELVGWLTLLAPEATGDAQGDAGAARTAALDTCKKCQPSADAGSVSIDDIMAPDLDLPLVFDMDRHSPIFQNT